MQVRYEPEAMELPLNRVYRAVLLVFLVAIQLCGTATWYHVFLLAMGWLPGQTVQSLQARMYFGQSWFKFLFNESDVDSLNAAAFYLLLILQVYTLTALLTFGSLLLSATRAPVTPAGGEATRQALFANAILRVSSGGPILAGWVILLEIVFLLFDLAFGRQLLALQAAAGSGGSWFGIGGHSAQQQEEEQPLLAMPAVKQKARGRCSVQ